MDLTPKAQTKENNTLDTIEIKNFCASKDSIKNVKRKMWKDNPLNEKIFVNHIFDKELVYNI